MGCDRILTLGLLVLKDVLRLNICRGPKSLTYTAEMIIDVMDFKTHTHFCWSSAFRILPSAGSTMKVTHAHIHPRKHSHVHGLDTLMHQHIHTHRDRLFQQHTRTHTRMHTQACTHVNETRTCWSLASSCLSALSLALLHCSKPDSWPTTSAASAVARSCDSCSRQRLKSHKHAQDRRECSGTLCNSCSRQRVKIHKQSQNSS
jgi:hypothetical protein